MTATLKRNPLPAEPHWLRAESSGREVMVDREANALRGMVVAQEGNFKTPGRGAFNLKSLKIIKALMNKERIGLKSRFAHPTLSSDGVGKFLGRVKNPSLEVLRLRRNGEEVLVNAVRADLFFDKTALEEPPEGGGKPLGIYVMDLAESDPDAISTSLVLQADEEEQVDAKGRPILDTNGEPLAPVWYPTALHASDIVDTGDAVDGILSANLDAANLPDALLYQADKMLSEMFPDCPREVMEARVLSWFGRYLDWKFGTEKPEPTPTPKLNGMRREVVELRTILAERGA